MKSLICRIFGHKWRFNFPIRSLPSKAMCARCHSKLKFIPKELGWEEVSNFENEKRSDEQLIHEWFKK